MTRTEFYESIDSMWKLRQFCYDHDLTTLDDVYSCDDMHDYLNAETPEYVGEYGWMDTRDMLNSIETGYDYYVRGDGWLEFDPISDDDFEDYRDQVADDMDGYWDEEDEEEEYFDEQEDTDDAEEDGEIEEEPLSIGHLLNACNSQLQKIEAGEKATKEADAEDLGKLLGIESV